ncbi:glycosyltransferase [Panacibacter ginsenosidivorans]|uniref:Glycosyltransferase n=1 Tax=Panacibacter ginsenosidivorans TaxID=1813871 RepID=A0A5B8VCB4_9BACT|nr:glycosyltransferase [Panacibacter ginsenosidivorans]QEC69084.1 glycosyltransferase [Panacibacter ginsenosidivorans]
MQIVSIIAVCYNQAAYVADTLNSIKAQTYPNIQLIVADDGSEDGSKEVIKNWIAQNDPSAIFIDHQKNLGLTKNINSALPYIKGDYFQVFGCDDIMLPDKIERQVALLQANKDAGIVYSDMQLIDKEGHDLPLTYFQKHAYKQPFSGDHYESLINRIIPAAPTVLIKKGVLEKTGYYNEKLDYEDYDYFLRAAKHYSFIYEPTITVKYRVLESSLSNHNVYPVKYFRNLFTVLYSNYDTRKQYRQQFNDRLLFCIKNLYSLKYKNAFGLFSKALLKTGDTRLLKYTIASIPFMFTGIK